MPRTRHGRTPAVIATVASLVAVSTALTVAAAATLPVTSQALTTSAQGGATPSPSPSPTTGTGPQLVSLVMLDVNQNGRVDQVEATFDKPMASPASTAGWTLSNVPSNGTKSSVALDGTDPKIVRLTLTEGPGALDTAVRGFTVALGNDSDIKDASGNKATFGARPPSDGARPRFLSVTGTNAGGTPGLGRLEQGDVIRLTFTEPMGTGLPAGSVTVQARDLSSNSGNNANAADRMQIVGITPEFDPVATELVRRGRTILFSSSTVQVVADAIAITLAPGCTNQSGNDGCEERGAVTSGSFSLPINSTLGDAAGNLVVNTSVSATHPIF